MEDVHIPAEIQEEILSRLTTTEVGQVRLVNQMWNNLSSSHLFAYQHLEEMKRKNILALYLDEDIAPQFLPFEVSPTSPNGFRRVPQENEKEFTILAYCNGLVCISDTQDNLLLANPLSGKSRPIPPTDFYFPHLATYASVFFGLTFVKTTKEYKLIRMSMYNKLDFDIRVKVFSFRSNQWRDLPNLPFDFPYPKPGFFSRGTLNWQLSFTYQPHSIATFNPSDETYGLINMPNNLPNDGLYTCVTGLDDDTIGIYEPITRAVSRFWVLRGYGEFEAWSQFNISVQNFVVEPDFSYFQPISILKPGDSKVYFRLNPRGTYCAYDFVHDRYYEVHGHAIIHGDRDLIPLVETVLNPNFLH